MAQAISSPETESSAASQHKTCVLQPVLGITVQAALACSTVKNLHGCAAQPEMCYDTCIKEL